MGPVGVASSMEVQLQRVFISIITEFVNSSGTVTVPAFLHLLHFCEEQRYYVSLNSLTGKVEDSSQGTTSWREKTSNILNIEDERLSKNSWLFTPLQNSFILLLYIGFKYLPICSSTKSIKTLYLELGLNDSTHKGKFWLNPCWQYFCRGGGHTFLKFWHPFLHPKVMVCAVYKW